MIKLQVLQTNHFLLYKTKLEEILRLIPGSGFILWCYG